MSKSKKVHIFIDSCTVRYRSQSLKLIEIFSKSHNKDYFLTESLEEADLILLTDARFDDFGATIRQNLIYRKYINKSFILSNEDNPLNLYRGLYASAEKSFLNFGRIRSCSYTALYDPLKNHYIENHDPKQKIEKKFLFSFIGRRCNNERDKIFSLSFNRIDILINDSTESFNLYGKKSTDDKNRKMYYETLLASKFSLCPRGVGAGSYRIFESLKLGIAPIIISDNWIFPKGPDWKTFSIIIKFKDLDSLERIVTENEGMYIEMGCKAKEAFDLFFSEKNYFDYIISNCIEMKSRQLVAESLWFKFNYWIICFLKLKQRMIIFKSKALRLILKNHEEK